MPIQLVCPGCGKQFRVADEHAGKKVKCPACQTVFQVPPQPQETPLPHVAVPSSGSSDPLHGSHAGYAGAGENQPMHRPNPYASPVSMSHMGASSPASGSDAQQTMGNIGLALGIIALVGEFGSGLGMCCCSPLALVLMGMVIPAGIGLALSMKSAGGIKTAGIIVNSIALVLAILAIIVIGVLMVMYGVMAFSLSQQNQGGGF